MDVSKLLSLLGKPLMGVMLVGFVGCLPSGEYALDEGFRGSSSNVTSVSINAPKSKTLKFDKLEMHLTQVDEFGDEVKDGFSATIKKDVSDELKSEAKIYSANYKVSVNLINGSDIVASSLMCSKEEHLKENMKIHEIFGEAYSLKVFICTKDGSEKIETEDKTTDVEVETVIVDSDDSDSNQEDKPKVEVKSSELVAGNEYTFMFKDDYSSFINRDLAESKACAPGKGKEVRAVFKSIHVKQKFEYYRIEVLSDLDEKCPKIGDVSSFQAKVYK